MGGIISGGVAAVVMVIYMNKTMPIKKGAGKRLSRKGGPSSGFPDEEICLDEEKQA
jgi:hypothetical protein